MSRDLGSIGLRSADEQASNSADGGGPQTTHETEPERTDGATVGQLYAELRSLDGSLPEMNVRMTPEQESEVIFEHVQRTLFEDTEFRFEETTIKRNLAEVLLVLVAHRSSNTNGKSLMGDLTALFGTRLSPGTVYPQLHELEESGTLRVQELVRTKEYQVDDKDALVEHVSAAMEQHLALGLFLRTALAELS